MLNGPTHCHTLQSGLHDGLDLALEITSVVRRRAQGLSSNMHNPFLFYNHSNRSILKYLTDSFAQSELVDQSEFYIILVSILIGQYGQQTGSCEHFNKLFKS